MAPRELHTAAQRFMIITKMMHQHALCFLHSCLENKMTLGPTIKMLSLVMFYLVVVGRILRWLSRFLPPDVYVLYNPLPLFVRGIWEYDGIGIVMIRLCYS